MSISTKFFHSMNKGFQDTRGGGTGAPLGCGKDFLTLVGMG